MYLLIQTWTCKDRRCVWRRSWESLANKAHPMQSSFLAVIITRQNHLYVVLSKTGAEAINSLGKCLLRSQVKFIILLDFYVTGPFQTTDAAPCCSLERWKVESISAVASVLWPESYAHLLHTVYGPNGYWTMLFWFPTAPPMVPLCLCSGQ